MGPGQLTFSLVSHDNFLALTIINRQFLRIVQPIDYQISNNFARPYGQILCLARLLRENMANIQVTSSGSLSAKRWIRHWARHAWKCLAIGLANHEFDRNKIVNRIICFIETKQDGKVMWIKTRMLHNPAMMSPACNISIMERIKSLFKKKIIDACARWATKITRKLKKNYVLKLH